jgi:hypothetical protein
VNLADRLVVARLDRLALVVDELQLDSRERQADIAG